MNHALYVQNRSLSMEDFNVMFCAPVEFSTIKMVFGGYINFNHLSYDDDYIISFSVLIPKEPEPVMAGLNIVYFTMENEVDDDITEGSGLGELVIHRLSFSVPSAIGQFMADIAMHIFFQDE